jgi:hypothetical protein
VTDAKPVDGWQLEVPSAQVAWNIQRRWHIKAMATWDRVARSHMSTCALYLRRSHVQTTTVIQCSMRERAFEESLAATRAWRKHRQHALQLQAVLHAEEAARG